MGLINKDEVIQILNIVAESNLDELKLEMGDLKLTLKKSAGREGPQADGAFTGAPAREPVVLQQPDPSRDQRAEGAEPIGPEPPAKEEAPAVILQEEGLTPIQSPMLGTFYRAPKPGTPSFVEVGQVVSEDDTVCIIEVMKLFNTIKAGVRGRISKVCVEDGQMVEFHQTLFLVEESAEDGP